MRESCGETEGDCAVPQYYHTHYIRHGGGSPKPANYETDDGEDIWEKICPEGKNSYSHFALHEMHVVPSIFCIFFPSLFLPIHS